MRLSSINVARTTEGTITVEFHGKGNELVTVRMSADSALNDEEAVMFAERMMKDLNSGPRVSKSTESGEGVSTVEKLGL